MGYELAFTALVDGPATLSAWDFGDGTVLANRPYASHVWQSNGTYAVVLTVWNADHPGGVACTTMVSVVDTAVFYANAANPSPLFPHTNWATAATRIQDAIDADSTAGRVVLVTNGVYAEGGRAALGVMTNRVSLENGVTLLSVNGPSVTMIEGRGPSGNDAVRCAYVGKDSVLSGFTLTNGGTRSGYHGGGVFCEADGMVSNCLLIANSASDMGGGAFGGVLANCVLNGNVSQRGGGALYSALNNCTLMSNAAIGTTTGTGGGVYRGTLRNCAIIGNLARNEGGGAYEGALYDCTLSGNCSSNRAGGASRGALRNCIIYYNSAPSNANFSGGVTWSYCCTWPSTGTYCVTNAPLFVAAEAGDYRLAPRSPCVDRGINEDWMFTGLDVAGNPRILNGRVDIGAYETPFTLNLRALLQGPYRTNAHAMVAGVPANIPLTSPYATDPRAVAAIPSNAVDWVLVELVGTNGATVVSKSAFLETGGEVLSAEGRGGITAEVSAGYYSVVLKHRNHLAGVSAQPVPFTNIVTAYDFTAGADRYVGGSNAAVQLEPGVWGLIAGDADGDGSVSAVDEIIGTDQLGQAGYHRWDFNLDGSVDAGDLAFCSANQGNQSAAADGGTPLASGLTISPERRTVVAGSPLTLTALGATGLVQWAFVANPSGGVLSPLTATSAVYVAGLVSNSVDVVQAWDRDRLGRAWINVIGGDDVTRAGKAIVIAGSKGKNDPVWQEIGYLGNLAYNTLLYRGYAKDNVRYLNPVTGQDVDGNGLADDVAAATTLANAAGTFTNWAMASTDRLFVYLVDHGATSSGHGYFRLNGEETLTAAQLDAWLDQIQDARANEVVVVLDFCYAGSFLEPLKREGRTVIAASGVNELTYFVAGGLVSFSDAFFGAVVAGQDLAGAFGLARDAMSSYQGALADADGSGGYAPSVDPPLMAGVYLGPSFISGKDIPQVGHVMGDQMLHGATTATLWAYDIVSAYPIDRVWCVVVPPSHDPDPQRPVDNLPTLDLTYNPTTGRYEAQYAGFTEMGVYKLVYYARDIWGSVSLPQSSFVDQAGYDERMVLVACGVKEDALWADTAKLAAEAYRTARARRMPKLAVRYLSAATSQDADGDGTNDVAAATSLDALGESISEWASGANRLTVYLLGSSTTSGYCRLNETETLSASQLDSWLDGFQGTNTSVLAVLDFDGSGSYLPGLAPPSGRERILIASTEAGARRICSNDSTISFSKGFLSSLRSGKSVGAAFLTASEGVRWMSRRLRQVAQLDDNGNGVPNEKSDGKIAKKRYLGAAFATGAEAPFIGSVVGSTNVTQGTALTLWADEVVADAGISNVWCVIAAPDYDGAGDSPEIDLPWNAGTDRYEALYPNLTLPGTYALTFYALDNEGQHSPPVLSLLTATDSYEPDDTNATAALFTVGEAQSHNLHGPDDEDWVVFYAPTGFAFNVDATQLGTNSDLVLDVFYELPDGSLEWIDGPIDGQGSGTNLYERAYLDLKTGNSGLEPGIYLVRVSSADTNLFGPGSDYRLEIYEPTGNSGGTITILARGLPGVKQGPFYVSFSPSNAPAAGAAWRIEEIGGSWRSDTNLYSLWVTDAKTWHIEFRDAAGFTAPADRALNLQADKTINVPAAYAPIFSYTNPVPELVSLSLGAGGVFQFQCLAAPGNYYAIEQSTNLIHWVPLGTNLVPSDGALPFSITNDPHQPRAFYRWRLIE